MSRLRNAERPIEFRETHQGLWGPERYNSISETLVGYINVLEERIYVLDLELSAMRDRFGHQLWPKDSLPEEPATEVQQWQQMEAVRAKNTELEITNRTLRENLRQWEQLAADTGETSDKLRAEIVAKDRQIQELQEKKPKHVPTGDPKFGGVDAFMQSMEKWCRETFGERALHDVTERACRLVEESIEAGQSVGLDIVIVKRIVDYVYAKPPGRPVQELGGVVVCWALMCNSMKLVPTTVMLEAANDCWQRKNEIASKHQKKIEAGISRRQADKVATGYIDPITAEKMIAQGRTNLANYIEKVAQPERGEG